MNSFAAGSMISTGWISYVDRGSVDLSANSLAASLLVGGVGLGFFIYGKKQARVPQLLAGIALMTYPAFIPNATLILVIAIAVIGALWVGMRTGAC